MKPKRKLKRFGKFIKLLREEAGIGSVELSQKMGQVPSYIGMLEESPKYIRVTDMLDIVEALELDFGKTMTRLQLYVEDGAP